MSAFPEHVTADVDLIIMGASTRAAAFSALRAGFRPCCLDFFGDIDTQTHVPTLRVEDYPAGLQSVLATLPPLPLCYTGGLENQPGLLEFAAGTHQLWGNDDTICRRSRDPQILADAARLARLHIPETRDADHPPATDGTWLLRPRAGSGGRGITLWTEDQTSSPTLQEPHLFQKKIEGTPCSAVFIASRSLGDVRFVGMTRQLIGEADSHARAFQWCGNIGPIALPVATENLVRRFGNVLKWKVGLLGLYGVDLIVDPQGTPWVIEVNPRYPASVELLEHATGRPLFLDHCRSFTDDPLPDSTWNRAHPGEFMGKAIYYSPRDFVLKKPLADAAAVPVHEFPEIADLPAPGTEIRQGEPVCTVFTESFSAEKTWELLKARLQSLAAELSE